jgi:hypothetical protein
MDRTGDHRPTLSVAQIIEIDGARWKIEAGFREIKQEIGSAQTQTRHPDAVTNNLNSCLAATTITWLDAASLEQAPARRYAAGRPNMPSPMCAERSPMISPA